MTLVGETVARGPSITFQLGDGHLVLHSSDKPLASKFQRLYGDCAVDHAPAWGPRIDCTVDVTAERAHVTLSGPEPITLVDMLETAFHDRGCRRLGVTAEGWQEMQCDMPEVTFQVNGPHASFAINSQWRHLSANVAIGCVLRAQTDVIFMHASGVAMGPNRAGVVFVGPKGAGKTTTSIGLAARGHQFFGDELIGIRRQTREIVPVRREIAKRDGPCDGALDSALEPTPVKRRRYGDGHWRRMITPGDVFGATPDAAPLTALVLLDGFGDTPALTRVEVSMATAARLTPVSTTLVGQSPAARIFTLLKLLAGVPCYALRLGRPEETSRLLETTFGH